MTRIFDKMVNVVTNTKTGKENNTWDALRKMASDINLLTAGNSNTAKPRSGIDAKQIAMKNLITALGGRPITIENMVNHFKELNTEQQRKSTEQQRKSRLQTRYPTLNKPTPSQFTSSQIQIAHTTYRRITPHTPSQNNQNGRSNSMF